MSLYLTIFLFILIILATGITGIIFVVKGIVDNIQKRWITGAVLVFLAIALSLALVVFGIRAYMQFIGSFIKQEIRCEDTRYFDQATDVNTLIFDDIEYFKIQEIYQENCFDQTIDCYANQRLRDVQIDIQDFQCIENNLLRFHVNTASYLYCNISVSLTDENYNVIYKTTFRYYPNNSEGTPVEIEFPENDLQHLEYIFFHYVPLE